MFNKFFDWISGSDEEIEELDRRIADVNARNAEKEAYIKQLKEDIELRKKTVADLENKISSMKKTLNRNGN